MNNTYQTITDRIIALLEEGTVPWHRPWASPDNFPKNLVSGKDYRGINAFMLSLNSYESPYWVTYKQAKERGGSVLKGEKGLPCIYWNFIESEDEKTGKKKNLGFLKRYTVFNVQQCVEVSYPAPEAPRCDFKPIERAEEIVQNMPNPPLIINAGHTPMYVPSEDIVKVPYPEDFNSPEFYYSVLFHELSHSTGHQKRLNRKGEVIAELPEKAYAKEELVAEMGAAYLCGHSGIERAIIENSASYIDNWLGHLKNDNTLVVQAAGKAQKSTDYILNQYEG